MDIVYPRMKMKFNSLAFRLFITSTALALIILPLAAYQLISVYRGSIEANFDERLKANLSLLIESSLQENYEAPTKPKQFGGFAFTLPNSGWYWLIRPVKNDTLPVYSSTSLGEEKLDLAKKENLNTAEDGTVKFYVKYESDRKLRVITRSITLGTDEKPQAFDYIVTGDSSEIEDDIIDFASMLTITFLILGAGLIASTFLQVRLGLRPLKVVENGLTAIRAGKTDRLEGNFPAEIAPLQFEINNLIKSNMNIIERARTHVGNLAHALKTPLSVMTNEVRGKTDPLADKVAEQTEIMQNQISHHLDRARMAARVGVVGSLTEISPIMQSLERALLRIYQDKNISFDLECPEKARFAGEKQDFEEIIGNLLDNAFKWANKKVSSKIKIESNKMGETLLHIIIQDDGPGLSDKELSQVKERGKRLDETKPGSGLGLSIVSDLVDLYGGKFDLSHSKLGGLQIKLQLPAGS